MTELKTSVAQFTINPRPTPTVPLTPGSNRVLVVAVGGPRGGEGAPGSGVTLEAVTGEEMNGMDGSRTAFATVHSFLAGTTAVYLNGLREFYYEEMDSNTIMLEDAPHIGDTLHIDYVIEG